ncbi:MAG: energy-coupling factor transporter transmembrane protein EcfT [Deltaproteobacteria bacterium]|nr:energy-coupling factor transporter transmembrane protein EcfT [Deltaproteobacteria bacterium]
MFDPRTKLIFSIFYAILVMVSSRAAGLTVEWGALILLIISMAQGKAYLRWLRLVVPMSLFFGAITWWSINLEAGTVAALKLLTLTTVFFVFFSTTLPEDLGNALVEWGLPYTVAFVLSTSLQFVPVISRKAKNVLDAQRTRGIPVEPGWSALRHYPAFFIPLLIQAFQLAEELAEAMESRGFGRPGRTFLKEYRMGYRDWTALGVGFLTLIALMSWQQL